MEWPLCGWRLIKAAARRLHAPHDHDLIGITVRSAEVAQVRSDCLSQFNLPTARGVTQQVRSFFCQNLCAQALPHSNREFIHRWQSCDECNARRAANADIELSALAKIGHSGHSPGYPRRMLGAHDRHRCGSFQKSCRQVIGDKNARAFPSLKIAFGEQL